MSETKGSFSHTLVHHSRSASKQSRNFILTCAKLPEVGVNLLHAASTSVRYLREATNGESRSDSVSTPECTKLHLRASIFPKILWGGMPPDPLRKGR